jgi:hypothetical protein
MDDHTEKCSGGVEDRPEVLVAKRGLSWGVSRPLVAMRDDCRHSANLFHMYQRGGLDRVSIRGKTAEPRHPNVMVKPQLVTSYSERETPARESELETLQALTPS